jgi:hypothetical protein
MLTSFSREDLVLRSSLGLTIPVIGLYQASENLYILLIASFNARGE